MQRWLFTIDYTRHFRRGDPKLGPCGIDYLPLWLKEKYERVEALNRTWDKVYLSFKDVLNDEEIIRARRVMPLDRKPWRVDIIEYTLWTMNDFLKDLTASMRGVDPHHLITITTDLPEVVPMPVSSPENSGVDFLSTVHYNYLTDYGRDWIGANRLIYSTKFIHDLSAETPVFINETGFRTSVLQQAPPNRAYGMGKDADKEFIARMYLDQLLLMQSLPWMNGWAFFKWHDKYPEGDFGYVGDHGGLKPVSEMGKTINALLPVNRTAEREPDFFIYYPEYFLASAKAGSNQLTALVSIIQNAYLSKHSRVIEEIYGWVNTDGIKTAVRLDLSRVIDMFNFAWVPFRFTSTLPADVDKPIIIAGRQAEQLSQEDRKSLLSRKVLCFERAGLSDERYHETVPWYLEGVGVNPDDYAVQFVHIDLFDLKGSEEGLSPENSQDMISLPESNVTFRFPVRENGVLKYISCAGQSIVVPEGAYTAAHFLAASSRENLARTVTLEYADGSREERYLGTTINDMNFSPPTGKTGWFGRDAPDGRSVDLAHITVPVSPAKNLRSIVLPEEARLRIYAQTLAQGGLAENVNVTVMLDGLKVSGHTDWVVSLRDAADADGKKQFYKVVARFENGSPAVLMSEDGKRVSFLYDALGWSENENEISRDTDAHSKLVRGLLRDLAKQPVSKQ